MTDTRKREPWNPLLKSYPFSEKINAVSIGAETLFTRLVAQADDYGNYYGSPRMILASLFPHRWAKKELTETDAGRWRTELVTCPFGPLAATYSVNGSEYLHLINSRRRFRSDVTPDERFPREPANIEEKALSEHVTKAARKRTVNVPLDRDPDRDPDRDKTEIKQKQDQKTIVSLKAITKKNGKVDQLIDYLNEISHSRFRHSEASRRPINARLDGEATEDDIKLVFDYKCACWLGDPEWEEHLNPETLCRPTKFEKNLNAAIKWAENGRPPLNNKARRKANDEATLKWVEEGKHGKPEGDRRIEQAA